VHLRDVSLDITAKSCAECAVMFTHEAFHGQDRGADPRDRGVYQLIWGETVTEAQGEAETDA